MIGAKVVLVDKTSDQQLPDPVTTIASPASHRLAPDQAAGHDRAGDYYLKALNGHGAHVAQSVGISRRLTPGLAGFWPGFRDFSAALAY